MLCRLYGRFWSVCACSRARRRTVRKFYGSPSRSVCACPLLAGCCPSPTWQHDCAERLHGPSAQTNPNSTAHTHSGRCGRGCVHRGRRPGRSPPPADHPRGRMLPSRCRTGTSSARPSPTWRLISASPGSRRLPEGGAAALASRLSAVPRGRVPALGNAGFLLHREVAKRPDGALTDLQSTASLTTRASRDARRRLHFRIRTPCLRSS
mgnify:CR=1 FL=1